MLCREFRYNAYYEDNKDVILEMNFKGNAQFIFLCNLQKSSVNVCHMKKSKSTVTKKVTVCFYNICEENF